MSTRRKLAWCLAALAFGALVSEALLRAILFSDAPWVRERAWRLRRAELYFDSSSDDDYWKLRHAIQASTGEAPAAQLDRELGWIDASLDPQTLQSSALPPAGDARRTVALFGSSFAKCMTPGEQCFEGLLARSELGDRLALANYGVRGYCIDQTYLLLARTLAGLAARKPIVIVGLFVDDDFDRTVLSIRGSPKPRFTLRHGQLVRESERVSTLDQFLREHPIAPGSYVWRGLSRALGLAHAGTASEAEKRELGAALLRAQCAELRARNVESFFVLFFGEQSWRAPAHSGWREPLALETLRAEHAHYVSTRAPLARYAAAHGGSADACFLHGGDDVDGHYSALGNEVVFAALLAGLEGRFDE